MRIFHFAFALAFMLAAAGCAELAQLGGLEVCISTGGRAAPSATPAAVSSAEHKTTP